MQTDRGAGAQAQLWNGSAGRGWVNAQALLDDLFQPFERLLLESAQEAGARRVLDVGCGTGAVTLALARQLGASGRALGIDISAPMIALARERAAHASSRAQFVQGDAQDWPFEPASFDTIVSRFGVMFFEDPVAAFANLRRAGTRAAKLRLLAWRSAEENPFMTVAERAAAPWLPPLPARAAHAPGQFAFADASRVRRILADAGWQGATIEPVDVPCTLPVAGLKRYFSEVGPVGRRLDELTPASREVVEAAVRAAFEPYVDGSAVRFTAACWRIVAG